MRRFVVVMSMATFVCSASAQQSTNEDFKMRATVVDVSPLQQLHGAVTPTDFDSRFVVTVRIESFVPSLTNYAPGMLASFAIHSPVRLFADDAPKGKTYDFVLSREIKEGVKGPFSLEVKRWVGQRNDAGNGSQPVNPQTNATSSAPGSHH